MFCTGIMNTLRLNLASERSRSLKPPPKASAQSPPTTHRQCVPSLLPRRYPGPLVALEVANYLATMERPRRPLGVAIGGAKVKDKIGVLR
jgi:hypothetical protein